MVVVYMAQQQKRAADRERDRHQSRQRETSTTHSAAVVYSSQNVWKKTNLSLLQRGKINESYLILSIIELHPSWKILFETLFTSPKLLLDQKLWIFNKTLKYKF
jgi:hypothetical protein